MADERLFVVHESEVVAMLSRRRSGRLVLEYDAAYAARRNATPLSISLPLSVATHGDAKVRPWLWGLLPDNDAVLTRWARDFGVSGSNPFNLLSTPVGEDCAGAFSFVPADRLDAVLAGEGDVEWLTDARVAAVLRELRVDQTSWLGTTPPGRFSLAGVQAKTALLWDGTRWVDRRVRLRRATSSSRPSPVSTTTTSTSICVCAPLVRWACRLSTARCKSSRISP